MKLFLILSAFIQYLRVRWAQQRPLNSERVIQICEMPALLPAKDEEDLIFALRCLRPVARRFSKSTLCLDLSLSLMGLSQIPTSIHFAVAKEEGGFTGHAWVESKNHVLTTDQDFNEQSIWSWRKNESNLHAS